tara:strand:+ start:2166 stop:2969 length:804 start_codon:yes stop_codon:yes gene_type:complete
MIIYLLKTVYFKKNCFNVGDGDSQFTGAYSRNTSYRAVIVEPRPHKALKPVLDNICEKLGCPITIVHGTNNKGYVLEAVKKNRCVDLLLEINAEQLDAKTYSKLFTTYEFWDKIRKNEEKLLIFQTDSGICGRGKDIYKFLQYDYCGAPWESNCKVGNGGFSIRNPELAKKHIRQYGTSTINEDINFSQWCDDDNSCNICPTKIGIEFSSETLNTNSWAFHNNFKFFYRKNQCKFNNYIKQLNNETPKYDYKIPTNDWKPVLTRTFF